MTLGAAVVNYVKITSLLKNKEGLIQGVVALDMETGETYHIIAKTVVNATGVFADGILQMDDPSAPRSIMPSQGIHLVLDKEFLQGDSAIMIPKTADGRVLFAVPWHKKVVVGTTDTLVDKESLEPRALEEEIEFILNTAAQYLSKIPTRADVKSIFAGLRPLAAPVKGKETKEISRSHKVMVSLSGMITTIGGKWTTYRKMGEDTIDKAILIGDLPDRDCITKNLSIHGSVNDLNDQDPLYVYGSDKKFIQTIIDGQPALAEKLHPALDYTKAEVVWAVRSEMARTVEDVLARRTRALFLDARASILMATETARLMAAELKKGKSWEENQVKEFTALAKGYLLDEKD